MPYPTISASRATTITSGVTTVECQKQVRSWRLLRHLIELLIPTCNCTNTLIEEEEKQQINKYFHDYRYPYQPKFSTSLNHNNSNNIITGTIFGSRRGKVRFCIQTNSKSTNPILLLELAVPTNILAREMQGGILRIALESVSTEINSDNNSTNNNNYTDRNLMSVPVWKMYSNGRKAGYAVKRKVSKADMDVLRVMDSVVVGAGVVSGKELYHVQDHDYHDDEIMYLRGNFKRVCGSSDSESYHLIDPDGNIGQELGIFFFRSR